jgi:hypothetical protein
MFRPRTGASPADRRQEDRRAARSLTSRKSASLAGKKLLSARLSYWLGCCFVPCATAPASRRQKLGKESLEEFATARVQLSFVSRQESFGNRQESLSAPRGLGSRFARANVRLDGIAYAPHTRCVRGSCALRPYWTIGLARVVQVQRPRSPRTRAHTAPSSSFYLQRVRAHVRRVGQHGAA